MRRAALLGSMVLLVVACAVRSDRVTPVISIPTDPITDAQNVGAGECLLTVGEPHGVRILTVDDTGPAAGVVEVGDVVTSFGGDPTLEATDLVDAVRSHEIGETVPFVATRNGETLDLEVTLGESPTTAGSARMGVEGVTVNDQARVGDLPLADGSVAGPFSRVIDIGTDLVVFDPVSVRWARLGLDANSDPSFTVIDDELYLIAGDIDSQAVTATAMSSGITVTLSTGDWQPTRPLPPLDGLLVFGATRDDSTSSQGVQTAIIGVDPAKGNLVWSIPIEDQSTGAFLPYFGYRDPYGQRLQVELTPLEGLSDTSVTTHLLVVPTPDGGAAAAPTVGIPETSLVLGWSGEDRLAWSAQGLFYATDPETGLTEPLRLASGDSTQGVLWPIGDDEHMMTYNGSSLLLIDIGGDAIRQITQSCPAPRVSGPGWSASG